MHRICSLVVVVAVTMMFPVSASAARVWWVDPYGTGDAPTIQAAIDSAAYGDSVYVECGTYYEHDLNLKSGIFMMSQTASQSCVIIDAQGLGRVMICDGVDDETWIVGFTFTGGHASGTGDAGSGGGMACINSSTPHISSCDFKANSADETGGGLYCGSSSGPYLMFCQFLENQAAAGAGLGCSDYAAPYVGKTVFKDNTTPGDGGGAHCGDNATPEFVGCTFLNNSAGGSGGCLFSRGSAQPDAIRSVFVFSLDGDGVHADDDLSVPTLACCDIYGNDGGDWVGRIADQDTVDGNFSADPLFCDTSYSYFAVEECSPCLPGNHPRGYECGGVIGQNGEGCGCGEAVEPASWGTIKALYR